MSFCTNCGKELTEGSRFCPNCGTPVNPGNENIVRNEAIHNTPLTRNSNVERPVQNTPVYTSSPKRNNAGVILSKVFAMIFSFIGIIVLGIGGYREYKFREDMEGETSKFLIKLGREISEYGNSTKYLTVGGILFAIGIIFTIVEAVLRSQQRKY